MNLLVMPNLYGLSLILWIVSVLTLSIGDEVKTDGIKLQKFINLSSDIIHQTSSSVVQPTPVSINSTKILNFQKNVVTSSFAREGGPISIASTTQRVSSAISQLEKFSDNLNIDDNLLKEKDDLNLIKKNNTMPKIVPRKGANEMSDIKKENSSFIEKTLRNDKKLAIESSTVTNGITTNKEHENAYLNNSKLIITDKQFQNTTVNSSLHYSNSLQQNVSISTTVMTPTMKEHKAKPIVTVAGPNNDKQLFVSPIRHLGMTKKIDYVLPVIVSLIALPVLGAIIFMVYKQGRDCWDKRHYRRMDFLIDGMYND